VFGLHGDSRPHMQTNKQNGSVQNYSLKSQRLESDKSEQINVRFRHYGAIPGKDGNNNAHNTHHQTPYVHLSLFRHIPTTSSLLALGPDCSLYAPVDPGTKQFMWHLGIRNFMNKRHSDCTSNNEYNLCLL